MLDSLQKITELDTSNALDLVLHSPQQLRHDFQYHSQDVHPYTNIVFAGMGGSSLQAEFIPTYPGTTVPFEIVKDYTLPSYVNQQTLLILASYSGNTEETLSVARQAVNTGAKIITMAAGGALQEWAVQQGCDFIQIPRAVQPRMAVLYGYRALVEVLVAHKVSADPDALSELEKAVPEIERAIASYAKEIPTEQNYAKQLALDMVGKTPIIYAGKELYPAAYKWKIGANENAKNTAWCGILPEFNHNEFIGWSSHPVEKPFYVIDLRSSFEHERVGLRFEITDRLLSGMRPKAHEVHAVGESLVEQLVYTVLLGDFATIYLGILNGKDPSPVVLVEKLKQELQA